MTAQDQDDNIKAWELPFVEDTGSEDDDKTNAFNRRSDWKYEPPEVEPEIVPPTAEEIEAIRTAAQQDGFEQGKAEGYETGLAEGRTEGHQQGLQEGHAEGLAQGLEDSRQQVDEQLQVLSDLINHLSEPVKQVDKVLEKELVLLAVSLARGVIRSEVKTNQEVIFQALSEGLKVLPVQENRYQIHLHPEDAELLKNHFSQDEMDKHNWLLIESPDMSRGGCDITTQTNAVDVSIERRVRDVIDRFLLDHGLDDITPDRDA